MNKLCIYIYCFENFIIGFVYICIIFLYIMSILLITLLNSKIGGQCASTHLNTRSWTLTTIHMSIKLKLN